MSYVAAAVTGSAIVGGIMQSNAAGAAAQTQADAANRATDMQRGIYDQQRLDNQPWLQAGTQALGQMQNPAFQRSFTMADFQADPGYAFRMQEGQKALERSAAARGGLNSGGTLKALDRYSQDLGSQEYGNAYSRFNNDTSTRFNRLASLAGLGQTANGQVGAAGQNYANQAGQNITGAGNAAAAGQIGQANAMSNMIGTGANTWMNYQMMNRFAPSNGGGGRSEVA